MYEQTPESLSEGWKIEVGKETQSPLDINNQSEGSPAPEATSCEFPLTIRIYILIDPRDMAVRYVGKTSGTLYNRLRQHINNPKNDYVATWIRSLIALGVKPIIEEIECIENSNDLDWQDRERFWIEEYRSRGCNLTNLDSGGNGGKQRSEETRKKIGESNRGMKRTDETRKKLRESHLGKTLSPEHVANMSKATKGIPRGKYPRERVEKVAEKLRGRKVTRTPEHQAKLTASQIGRKKSAETRAKISAAQKGKKRGPRPKWVVEKIAAALKGRIIPLEQRKNQSISALKRWGKLPTSLPEGPSPELP